MDPSCVSETLRPFRNVPNEILQSIFDYSCDVNYFRVVKPTERKPETIPSSLRRKPALVLSSVNSKWRSNALAMPRIFARVKLEWFWHLYPVEDKNYDAEEHKRLFFPLVDFFSRSSQYPVSLTLFMCADPNRTGSPVTEHPLLKQLVIAQMNRLEKFIFQSTSSLFSLKTLFGNGDGWLLQLPQLTDVHLMTTESVLDSLWAIRNSATKLKKLAVERPIRWSFGSIPYRRLFHLEIRPTESEMGNFPKFVVNLGSLVIEDHLYYGSSCINDIPSPTTCSLIESLAVRVQNPPDDSPPWSICQYLTLPSLRTLSLERSKRTSVVSDLWSNFDLFMDFVERSSFPLTSLSLESLRISDSQLVVLLSHLPTLLNLTVSDAFIADGDGPITSRFFGNLHSHQTTPLVPNLHSLRLNTAAYDAFDDTSVVDMVKSRWIPGAHSVSAGEDASQRVACLREFTIVFRNREEVQSDVYEPLKELEKNGMRAVVLWKKDLRSYPLKWFSDQRL